MTKKLALLMLSVCTLLGVGAGSSSAGNILWYTGHSGYDEGHTQIVALYATVGGVVDVNSDPTLPSVLTGYNLIFIVMPGFTNPSDTFGPTEKANLASWLNTASHRVVMVGDWDGFYQGQAVMADLLAYIGNPIVFVPGAYDTGCGHCAGPMGLADPLTAGLTHVCYGLTPTWNPTYGKPLEYPEDPNAPGPWIVTNGTDLPCIVGYGDQNGVTDPCGYLDLSAGDADSKTFAIRLFTVTCAGDPQFACCLPTGNCQMLTRVDCDAAQGTFYVDQNCSQIVCNPSPTEISTWGKIKRSYR